MRIRTALIVSVLSLAAVAGAFAWQKPFREYPGVEYDDFPLPPDYQEKTEWVFARLMYPAIPTWGYRGNPNWKAGNANWTIDYPRSDRHLAAVIRRLTRIHARSVEQPIDLDDGDDVFNYPWLYAVEVGFWDPTDEQAKKLREYLLRGGFFMTDDNHGTQEWAIFTRGMKKVFPDRPIVDIPNDDPIFHVLYDLSDRFQVPGAQFLWSGRTYEKDGFEPRWRGIYDDNGRVMVAMCHNMDLGDSWEWADDPRYPEKLSSMGMKIATNYVVYAMTH
jgi:hypothetical protein